MVQFTTTILKFKERGEKSGWTYIEVPADIALQLKPGHKKSFRVKGKLDNYKIAGIALLPMGGGAFIIPINAEMRKAIAKRHGSMLTVQLREDKNPFQFNCEFMLCLADEPDAKNFFSSLTGSHQRYFSKWIDAAKTEPTRVKRIAMAVNALAKKQGYPEMIRASSGKL